MGKRKYPDRKKPPKKEQETDQEAAQNSFIGKLTSNIEILIDGVSLGFEYMGNSIGLVASNLKIHILNGKTFAKLTNIRAFAKNEKTSVSLTINLVDVEASEAETNVDVNDLSVTVSNPNFFELIKGLSTKLTIIGEKKIIVKSESQMHINVHLSLLPPILELINSFATAPKEKANVIPEFDIKIIGIYVRVQLTDALSAEMSIARFRVKNGKYEIKPIEIRILIRGGTIPILEPAVITGTLEQIDKTIKASTEIEMLKIPVPLSKDLIEQLMNIKLELPPPPVFPPFPLRKINETAIKIRDMPIVSTSGKMINFEFPYNVIPTGFSFGKAFDTGNKIMLRVWDDAASAFIAFSSFEINKQADEFSMDESQMIPLYKYQLVLPKNVSEYDEVLEKIQFSYLFNDKLEEQLILSLNIKQVLITLESLELPAAAISITNVKGNAFLGPLDAVRFNGSLGLSILLTNLRNQTMCSIFDMPSITLSASLLPVFSEYFPEELQRHRNASVIQAVVCADSITSSIKISSISLNVVPTILADATRFISTFNFASAIGYKVVNQSDIPFVFQVSTSSELIQVMPGNERVITFTQGQVHYIFFPSLSLKVMLNAPASYHISDTNYIAVEVIGAFSLQVSLRASSQFHNFLNAPADIEVKSPTMAETIKKHIDIDGMATSSLLLDATIAMKLQVVGITTQTKEVVLTPKLHTPPQLASCDVLNMLPPIYLCAPRFCSWIVSSEFEIDCANGFKHRVQDISLLPVLVVNNKLNVHVVTSAGVIPPNTSKYISQLNDQSIVFDSGVTLKVGFPLARGVKQRLMIMGMPALVETVPETNTIVITSNYSFYNGCAFSLMFRVNNGEPLTVLPNKYILLDKTVTPSVISVGIDYNGFVTWSQGLSIPLRKEVTLKTKTGNLLLILDITESKTYAYPMYVAINESRDSIWLNENTELTPETQAQLLLWRGKSHLISFSFSKNSGYIPPVDLDETEYLVRKFIGSYPSFSESTYVTYSVQSKSEPHTIVFHNDNAPPMTIVNQTPLSFEVTSGSRIVGVAAQSTTLLPEVPLFLEFKRPSADPFVIPLQASAESIITSHTVRIFARVEIRGTQSRVTLSTTTLPQIPVKPRISASLFIADIKIRIYNDLISTPGVPTNAACITISPISVEIFHQEGNNTSISLMLDTLQIDSLFQYENFPVIISKSDPDSTAPFVNFTVKLCATFNRGFYIDLANLELAPVSINIEESVVRYLVNLIALLPKNEEEEKVNNKQNVLVPRFFRIVNLEETLIFLSFSKQTHVHANFRNIPILLSKVHLENLETFDVSLAQTIIAHYTSDIFAAVPSIFTSLSWLGSPENLVKQSLSGIREFASSLKNGGSLIGGLKKGSLSLMRGISVGALESLVSFSSSLERSIAQMSPLGPGIDDVDGDEISKKIMELARFPIDGFQNNGVVGIVTGTGKTLMGLITGPTTLLLSLVNKAGVAILNQVGSDDTQVADRRIEKTPKDLPFIVFE